MHACDLFSAISTVAVFAVGSMSEIGGSEIGQSIAVAVAVADSSSFNVHLTHPRVTAAAPPIRRGSMIGI